MLEEAAVGSVGNYVERPEKEVQVGVASEWTQEDAVDVAVSTSTNSGSRRWVSLSYI